ncbi:endonuclease/exonuclease/phosphatase family protein [Aeoliella sp. ICT_H6.2]|uniref:Endonuclease/exonuclease/phosphatase family protein n=1 Tax=Aeoliella straminimaris TaxID=2954799 RepID=A0A9X2FA55_9BACT|nr:endonuclease/exonuclease/phosphatase family protein [Aeoliella straminimaris]MCO6042529.1 endonuclease/exonuclease/phosphatase family protein [Aeoliella straminimaris]
MKYVRIEYAENIISRTMQGIWQEMSYMVRVENLSYQKNLEVHWRGEDGQWHQLEAGYHCTLPDGSELWCARTRRPLTPEHSLPGDIRFSVCLHCAGHTHWDNNHGLDYRIDADSGVIVYRDVPVQNLFHHPVLQGGKVSLSIDAAVRSSLHAKNVRIHWSTDKWQTSHVTRCFNRTNHWDMARGSVARNPNRHGWEIWTGRVPIQHSYRVEYAIECESDKETIWENCGGANYQARRSTLRVLTLNLHCYQESNQDYKFRQIAQAIQDFHIDLVCLQEVAENWNDGHGDWASNAARVINSYLPFQYHLHTDFSHLGFDRYREGVAILSKHEFSMTDSGYVSDSQDIYDIHARRIVMAQVHVPYFGPVNLFSAHLSWPEDGFYTQFDRMRNWADERHGDNVTATLLCGDFNIKAGSDAYCHIVRSSEYEDQYLKFINRPAFESVFGTGVADIGKAIGHDGRIDYIFLKRGSRVHSLNARELFTKQSYGRVSDHTGYYVEFELL